MSRLPASTSRARSLLVRSLAAAWLAGVAVVVAVGTGTAASTGATVVGATVPSATTLTTTACATGTPATSFGTVTPGSTATVPGTCTVAFGSSNDTSRLRMYQADGGGDAMWRPPTGPVDGSVGGGAGWTSHSVAATSTTWITGKYDPTTDRYYLGGRRDNGAIVARYLPDGTRDLGWAGGDGWIVPAMGTGTTDSALDLEVQPDGKVVVSGRMFDAASEFDRIGAFRLTTAGDMDPAFGGGDGWVSFDYGDPVGSGLALMPDGDIVLVGTDASKGADGGSYALRLNPDGSPDLTWGNGDSTPNDGISFLHEIGPSYAHSVDVDPTTGQLVVAGRMMDGPWQFTTWRLLGDGARDMSWGGDGIGQASLSNYAVSSEVRVHHDGSVFVAGEDDPTPTRSVVVKFTSNGAVDTTWGASGYRVLTPPGSTDDSASALELLADGSLYVGGYRDLSDDDGYVAKLTPSGVVDTSFGASGYLISAVDASNDDSISEFMIGRDGELVAVGGVYVTTERGSFAAWTANAISDYGAGATWLGAGEDAFGACMTGLTNATGTGWTAGACSTAADSAAWHGIPDDAASGSVATVASQQSGSATFTFALRTLAAQPPGAYFAPVQFELAAPG